MDIKLIPPHFPEAERAVIGSALLYADRALANTAGLRHDEFMLTNHRDAWEAIRAAERKPGGIVDVISVGAEVKAFGTEPRFERGWGPWAVDTAKAACLPEQVSHFAGMVREAAAARKLIALCAELQARAYTGTPWPELLDQARAGIGELETAGADSLTRHIYEPMKEFVYELDQQQQGIKPEIISTSIATLDGVLDGFEGGQLIVVAARPGKGKTALACNMAAANALRCIPCLIFSLEMRMRKLARRMLIWATKITGRDMAGADKATWKKIQAAAGDFENSTLWLNDRTMRLGQIVAEACRWHARHVRGKSKRAIVFVDYAQLIRGASVKGAHREQEVAAISAAMKGLAMHLDIPVVLLAQLNRECEKRGGVPLLSDLRESGAIEQDADIVLFPHREIPAENQAMRNEAGPAEIIVAKNRDGRIGSAAVQWIPELMTFHAATDPGVADPQDWKSDGPDARGPHWADGKEPTP